MVSVNNQSLQPDLLGLMAARNGHFQFESGHHGRLWLELDALHLRSGSLQPFVADLAAKLSRYGIQGVCGPLTGGAFLAQMVAAVLEVEFYYAERFAPADRETLYAVKYRIPPGLRKMLRGKNLAIVDDVINAGSAVRGTLAEARACDANPMVVGALLVLGSTASRFVAGQNILLESVAHLPNDLWPPEECPLCASHTPLEDLTPEGPDRSS